VFILGVNLQIERVLPSRDSSDGCGSCTEGGGEATEAVCKQ